MIIGVALLANREMALSQTAKSQTTTTAEIYAHFRKCMPAVEGISVGVLNNNNLLKLHTFLLIFDATVHSYYDRVTLVTGFTARP